MKIQASPVRRTPLKNSILQGVGRTLEGSLDLSNTLSALPKFIYPTVTGSAEQKALVFGVLDRLPMHHAVQPTSIQVVPEFAQRSTLGTNKSPFGAIKINQDGYGMTNPDDFQGTVSHEVGHSVDHRGGMFSVLTQTRPSDSAPFGSGPRVSEYAGTNPKEDFAESYQAHFQNPGQLQDVAPEKEAILQKLDKPGLLDQLVDRPAYRETGKWIAQQFESCPDVRTYMEVARQGSIAFLGLHGVGMVAQGLVDKSNSKVAQGILQSGASACLAATMQHPWLGLAAAASLGASRGLQVGEKAGADGARQTCAAVGGAVGGVLGGFAAPLALTQAGYSLAGPIGGAVGLVVGGVLGSQLGSRLGAKAALALTQDQ